jgi:DNA-directed RNA polymerase specialized sigma24 family protein
MRQIEGNADELEHLSHQFDSFAKSVINYCARDVVEKVAKGKEREKEIQQALFLEERDPAFEDLVRLLEGESFVVEGDLILIQNEMLAEALRKTQKRKREVILLFAYGYNLDEISEKLKITYETAKSTKSKALKEIRSTYGESIF